MLFMDFATDAAVELRQELTWLIDFTAFTTPTSRNRNTKIIRKGEYDLTYTMLAVPESSRWVQDAVLLAAKTRATRLYCVLLRGWYRRIFLEFGLSLESRGSGMIDSFSLRG